MPMRRITLILSMLLMVAVSCRPGSDYVLISGPAQGGVYSVKLRAGKMAGPGRMSENQLQELKAGIDSVLQAVDHSVSGYNPGSVLSRFNAGERVSSDTVIREMYRLSRESWKETGGAVDVAAGALFDIWGFGFTHDSLPSDDRVREVLEDCGMKILPETFDEVEAMETKRPKLNFNCIAQGYSCDLVADYLHSKGIHDMLINVGGEIFCEGVNPSGQPWCIGIDKPFDGNNESGAVLQGLYRVGGEPRGVVTSGNYRKFYVRDGRKYSHTIDPRSGYPVSHSLLCATVVAPDATRADALATYCMVVGLEEASNFILADDSLEACLVYDEDGVMKAWTSPGFVLEEQ